MPNLFPETNIDTAISERQTGQAITFGRSFQFDFGQGDFVVTPTGRIPRVAGMTAYIQWCRKTLLTPRYRHPIYSRNYGVEFEEMIGKGLTREAVQSEITRMATEALMVDPRTASISNFAFTWDGDAVTFTCDVTTVQGDSERIGTKVVTA